MSKSELPAPEIIEQETNSITLSKSEIKPSEIIELDKSSSTDIEFPFDQKSSSVFCKICHSGGSNEQLIQPCLCKGSVGHVHLSCLERWLNECSVDRCELCLFQFTAEHTPRYTIWQSMVIWARHPTHRSLLFSDSIVMIVMTVVVAFLLTSLVLGMHTFKRFEPGSSVNLWGNCLIAMFITAAIIGYVLSMYSIIKDNFRPWYRWWQNCNDIRLIPEQLSPAVLQ